MSGGRMRRVDEAMREVLVGCDHAGPQGPPDRLRDRDRRRDLPRPAPRPRVRVRARRRTRSAAARSTACGPRTASCSGGSRASCGSSTRRRSSSPTTTPSTARCASRRCSRRRAVSDHGAVVLAAQLLDEIADSERFLLCTHEHPDGDALGSLAGMQQRARRARQGRGLRSWRPTSSRCPTSTASSSSEPRHRAAGRPRRAHDRLPGLRQHRPQPGRRAQARGRAHPQRRPPPRQHALRDGQPRGARGVVDGRDRVGPPGAARRRGRRGRSPRRCTSAWSPTPASSCTRTPGRARTGWPPS